MPFCWFMVAKECFRLSAMIYFGPGNGLVFRDNHGGHGQTRWKKLTASGVLPGWRESQPEPFSQKRSNSLLFGNSPRERRRRLPLSADILGLMRKTSSSSTPDDTEVVPFERYGVGVLTAHPVGLVVVFGLLVLALIGLPEARWFVAGVILLGTICGFFLWLRHR